MTISQFIKNLAKELSCKYPKYEAISIAEYYVENSLKISKSTMILKKDEPLNDLEFEKLNSNCQRLINEEPVQYVCSSAWFYGLNFFVDSSVLIPRQETEIIVDYIIKNFADRQINILDIGCGSGCISTCLKKYIPLANVYAADISEKALEVSKINAKKNNVIIDFVKHDILSDKIFLTDTIFDIVVSNPPYVLNSERKIMNKNVTDYEPEIALYVNDEDPLLFYRKILEFISRHQNKKTEIFFEINEKFANECIKLCQSFKYDNCNCIKDLSNKDRFIHCK